jgi:hypothetical protein
VLTNIAANKENYMYNKRKLSNGLTRWQMMYNIKMEYDTNSACYKMTDEELVATYNELFNFTQKDLTTAD